jgi:5-oxoprolinase (ATP-hydrolysing)
VSLHILSPPLLLPVIGTLQPLVVSILSERRAFQPYGLHGGEPGARGVNLLSRIDTPNENEGSGDADCRVVSLGGKNTVVVNKHDRLTILTPGGGGYGDPEDDLVRPDRSNRQEEGHVPVRDSGSLLAYTQSQESA